MKKKAKKSRATEQLSYTSILRIVQSLESDNDVMKGMLARYSDLLTRCGNLPAEFDAFIKTMTEEFGNDSQFKRHRRDVLECRRSLALLEKKMDCVKRLAAELDVDA